MRLYGVDAAWLVVELDLVPVDETKPIEILLESGRLLTLEPRPAGGFNACLHEPEFPSQPRLPMPPRECGYCHGELLRSEDSCGNLHCMLLHTARVRGHRGTLPVTDPVFQELGVRLIGNLERHERTNV